jgi:hypothetical protein
MRERQEREKAEAKEREEHAKAEFTKDIRPDALLGNRVHCWVLIKKGRRELREDLYIEPSTGTIFRVRAVATSTFFVPCADRFVHSSKTRRTRKSRACGMKPTTGMRVGGGLSLTRWSRANVQEATPQKTSFELEDSACWEYVLIDERQVPPRTCCFHACFGSGGNVG